MLPARSMVLPRLRTTLRKIAALPGRHAILSVMFAATTSACAAIAGLGETTSNNAPSHAAAGGSTTSVSAAPADTTLPAAPPTNCGDVANSATNCGSCGHSCGADSCTAGFCTTSVVVQATSSSINAFATDGSTLVFIDQDTARKCNAQGPATQTCDEIISADEVGTRVQTFFDDNSSGDNDRPKGFGFGFGGLGGGGAGGGGQKQAEPKKLDKLIPKALALLNGRVFIADDAYHAIIACQTSGAECDHDNVALIDASTDTNALFGLSLAVSATRIAWTQGDALRATEAVPVAGAVTPTNLVVGRTAPDTTQTTRIVVPDANVFWLSTDGFHRAADVVGPDDRWSAPPASDFSVATKSVYLSSDSGVYRIDRGNQGVSASTTDSAYTHIAVDDNGVFATKKTANNTTTIVEVRTGSLLPVAIVQGDITAIAITADHVYFAHNIADGSEIERVAR